MSIENQDGIKPTDIYREQYAHFRAMNDILYKIPPLFTVAIGGIWYFAVQQLELSRIVSCGLFLFAAAFCGCGMNIFDRFGDAFNGYLNNLNKLDGEYKVSIKNPKSFSTISTIKLLLGLAAFISVIAAGYAAAHR